MRGNLSILILLVFSIGIKAQDLGSLNDAEKDSVLRYAEDLSLVNPTEALKYSRNLQTWGLNASDSLFYADAVRLEALSHYRTYRFREAQNKGASALRIYEQVNNVPGIIQGLINLGRIEAQMGSNYEALLKLEEALKLARSAADAHAQIDIDLLISRIFLVQNQLDSALSYAQNALQICHREDLKLQRGNVYNLLAEIKLSEGDIDKSMAFVDNARLIHKGLGQSLSVSETYALAARINMLTGNLSSAEDNIRKALEISEKYYDPYRNAGHYLVYSRIAYMLGDTTRSLSLAGMAHQVASDGPDIVLLNREITRQLVDAFLLSGDSAMALLNLLELNALDDSIRKYDFQKLMLKRDLKSRDSVNKRLQKENSYQEQLFERSRLLLLLAAGLIIVFALLVFALAQNILRKRKYSRHLMKKNEMIKTNTEDIRKQQEELKEKNKRLEQMDKAKNKIFSVISHDLRQPITQIKSVLNLLEAESMTDDERVAMASKLRESVDNSSNALENLLLWSKKQLTGLTTRVVDIHLLPQVWQMESHLKPNLQAKNIKLTIKIPDFFKIKGDMNQLDICLKNLVSNAIKFTNPGGEIIVSAFEQGDYDVVKVKDNGVGMDEEQLKQLQDASKDFSTLGTMSEKGTGLGVMLVNEFMHSQNGELRIESVKNEGSSFSLMFPRTNPDYRKETSKTNTPSA